MDKILLSDGYIGYFDYLRPTPANRRLLSLTAQHPGARVEENPAA